MEARINKIQSSTCPAAKNHLEFAQNQLKNGEITESELFRIISDCEAVIISDVRWEQAKTKDLSYKEMIEFYDK